MNPEPDTGDDRDFLIDFFKALSDPGRLRVAGRLAASAAAVSDLARDLNLPLKDCARHVARLVELGLVREDAAGRPPVYELNQRWLRERARASLDSPRSRALQGATDERSRVLASFFRDGRLLAIPTSGARKLHVLDEVAAQFDSNRTYAEREVNVILKSLYELDYITLRRLFVDYHYLNRSKGVYWVGEGRRDPASAAQMSSTQKASVYRE